MNGRGEIGTGKPRICLKAARRLRNENDRSQLSTLLKLERCKGCEKQAQHTPRFAPVSRGGLLSPFPPTCATHPLVDKEFGLCLCLLPAPTLPFLSRGVVCSPNRDILYVQRLAP